MNILLKYSPLKYQLGIWIPLVFCGLVSVCFRPPENVINSFLSNQFNWSFNLPFQLPAAVVYSLPEGLWVFSLTLIFGTFKPRLLNAFLPLAYVWVAELFQYTHITDGTFDWFDLFFGSAGWLLACLLLSFNKLDIKSAYQWLGVLLFFVVLLVDLP